MQIHFSLPAAKGQTLQREPFSAAISAWFHFAHYKMLLWQIMVNHVIQFNFISFPLLNPVRFVYYIYEKNEIISINYILISFSNDEFSGYPFSYLYLYIQYHCQPNQSFGLWRFLIDQALHLHPRHAINEPIKKMVIQIAVTYI
jgi:hypothetical protein